MIIIIVLFNKEGIKLLSSFINLLRAYKDFCYLFQFLFFYELEILLLFLDLYLFHQYYSFQQRNLSFLLFFLKDEENQLNLFDKGLCDFLNEEFLLCGKEVNQGYYS